MTKVLVDKKALGAVISALNGQPHEIRELIALRASKVPGMRSISDLLGEKNPIDQLEEDLLDNCTATEVLMMGLARNDDPRREELAAVDYAVLAKIPTPPVWEGRIKTPQSWPAVGVPGGAFPDEIKIKITEKLEQVIFAIKRKDLNLLVGVLEQIRDFHRQWHSGQSWERIVLCASSLIREQRESGKKMYVNDGDVEVTGVSVYLPNGNADFTVNVDWCIKQHLMVPKFDHDQVLPILQHNGSDVYARFTNVGTMNGQFEFHHVHDETPGNVEVCEPFDIAMTHIPLQEQSDKIIESYRKLHVIWPKG